MSIDRQKSISMFLSAVICIVPVLSIYLLNWNSYQVLFLYWLEGVALILVWFVRYILSGIYFWRNLLFTIVTTPILMAVFVGAFSAYFLVLASFYDSQHLNHFSVWRIHEMVYQVVRENDLLFFAIGVVAYAIYQSIHSLLNQKFISRSVIFPKMLLIRMATFHVMVFVIVFSEQVLGWSVFTIWFLCALRFTLDNYIFDRRQAMVEVKGQ